MSVGPHALFSMIFCWHGIRLQNAYGTVSVLQNTLSESAYSYGDAREETSYDVEGVMATLRSARLNCVRRIFIAPYRNLLAFIIRELQSGPTASAKQIPAVPASLSCGPVEFAV